MKLTRPKQGGRMLDLFVLKELERKKKIPKEWLLKDRKKEFIVCGSGKKEQK